MLRSLMSVRRPPLIAIVVALLVPLLVFGVSWRWLQRPPETTGKAKAMERILKGTRPDVVVLGSSLARTNVRTELLADELGIPRRNVVLLTLPNATAAHWYAVMKNRIFESGYRPRAVIMVGALTTMVTPDVLKDSNVERLVNQLSDDEPVIGAKVFGTTDPDHFRYLYMREQAGQIRDNILQTWRDHALGLTFLGATKRDAGARLADRANELVFADELMDYELYRQQATGLYVGAVEEIDLEGLDIARESLIPDLAALAEDHGARAVFVRTPFPPSNNDNDFVPPDREAEATTVMSESGAIYIDLRGLGLDDTYFRDMRHMSREGATIFTRALAASMKDLGAMRRKGAVATTLGVDAARVVRSESPEGLTDVSGHARRLDDGCTWALDLPGLSALRPANLSAIGRPLGTPLVLRRKGEPLPWLDGAPDKPCSPGVWFTPKGALRVSAPKDTPHTALELSLREATSWVPEGSDLQVTWVYPGTTLRHRFDEPWPHGSGSFEVLLVGDVLGGEDGAVPELRVAGEALEVQREGTRVWALLDLPGPVEAPWTLEIASPEGGPWVHVQNLSIGRAPFTSHLVGLPEMLTGSSIRIVGGKVEDTEVEPVYRNEPVEISYPGRARRAPRGTAMLAVPRFKALADAPNSRAAHPHKCSPLRVLEDGEALPEPHVTCMDMANLKAGRSCHAGNILYFTASDSTDPTDNGRDYRLAVDPDRVCDRRNQADTTPLRGSLWLYPEDHLVLEFPADKLEAFDDGANHLEYALDAVMVDDGSEVDVRLFVEDRLVYERTVTAVGHPREYRDEQLDRLAPHQQDIRLEVVNRSDSAWWLLVLAALSEETEWSARVAEPAIDPEGLAAEDGGEDDVPGFLEEALNEQLPELAGERVPDRVERVGAAPEGPELKDLRAVRDEMVEGHAFPLWPISNSVLSKGGYGWWSPVRLFDGDAEVPMAPTRGSFKQACRACFLHIGQSIVSRPPDGTGENLRVAFAEEVPVSTPAGGWVHWVYPGTSLVWHYDEPWSGEKLWVRVLVDAFSTDKDARFPTPRLRVAGQEAELLPSEDGWRAAIEVTERPEGPWTLELLSPADGAWLLVLGVELIDGEGRFTVVPSPGTTGSPSDVPTE